MVVTDDDPLSGFATQVFMSVWISFVPPAFGVILLVAIPGDAVGSPWVLPVVAGSVYVVALAARASFRWRAGTQRGYMWAQAGSGLVTVGAYCLLRSGPEGRFWFVVLLALLCGYIGGLGLARARVLRDMPQAPPPRFVWQMRKPQPSWRQTSGDPPDPPYRGH